LQAAVTSAFSRVGRLLSPPLLAAMMRPQGPDSKDVEQHGYGLELVVGDGA
jgi:hypothetical protein